MTVNAYSFVGMYAHALDGLAHLLAKGAAHASASGVSEAQMLDWRLIEDMQPLRFQIMVVCNFSCQWPARAAGLALPEDVSLDLDLPGFRAAIAKARAWLAALGPEQFEGRGDTPLTIPIGDDSLKPTLPAGRWLTIFATTNIYFHLSPPTTSCAPTASPSARWTCSRRGCDARAGRQGAKSIASPRRRPVGRATA